MGNSMNITNTSDTTIRVLVAPDPEWKISDIFVGANSFTVGKYDEIHTLKDLWTVWNNIIGLKDFENKYDMVSQVKSLFDKYGIQVGPGKMCKMYDSEVLNIVDDIKPEAWSAMKDTLEVAVAVFVDDCNGGIHPVGGNPSSKPVYIPPPPPPPQNVPVSDKRGTPNTVPKIVHA
ncbi:Hypothetical predicted protein [Mytilus galloprovincialis]|uniref:Uncharacterized protein n=1 Tax=Mytilus galloprovincialis TaxID=29158 RepID=A0A8B6HPA7_MYTGA|nr:Hypothetical predicted protein [Mytilus galloprovincialis]